MGIVLGRDGLGLFRVRVKNADQFNDSLLMQVAVDSGVVLSERTDAQHSHFDLRSHVRIITAQR